MKVLSENKVMERTINSMAACKKNQPSQTIVHAQLEMTKPGDADENEANAMADAIVSGGKIRRQISNGTSGSGIAVSTAMESQLAQTQGGGRTMPEGLRNMMETGFGRDFSNVRIHTDSQAVAMSENLSAKAFTLGNDIYFNKGQFAPNTTEGQHLVAHELTHVVQGSGKVGREFENNNLAFDESQSDIYNDIVNCFIKNETYKSFFTDDELQRLYEWLDELDDSHLYRLLCVHIQGIINLLEYDDARFEFFYRGRKDCFFKLARESKSIYQKLILSNVYLDIMDRTYTQNQISGSSLYKYSNNYKENGENAELDSESYHDNRDYLFSMELDSYDSDLENHLLNLNSADFFDFVKKKYDSIPYFGSYEKLWGYHSMVFINLLLHNPDIINIIFNKKIDLYILLDRNTNLFKEVLKTCPYQIVKCLDMKNLIKLLIRNKEYISKYYEQELKILVSSDAETFKKVIRKHYPKNTELNLYLEVVAEELEDELINDIMSCASLILDVCTLLSEAFISLPFKSGNLKDNTIKAFRSLLKENWIDNIISKIEKLEKLQTKLSNKFGEKFKRTGGLLGYASAVSSTISFILNLRKLKKQPDGKTIYITIISLFNSVASWILTPIGVKKFATRPQVLAIAAAWSTGSAIGELLGSFISSIQED